MCLDFSNLKPYFSIFALLKEKEYTSWELTSIFHHRMEKKKICVSLTSAWSHSRIKQTYRSRLMHGLPAYIWSLDWLECLLYMSVPLIYLIKTNFYLLIIHRSYIFESFYSQSFQTSGFLECSLKVYISCNVQFMCSKWVEYRTDCDFYW